MSGRHDYIPALGVDWLTPFYDVLQRWVMQEVRYKRDLAQQVTVQPGQSILDLGCGTATLTLMLKHHQPDMLVVGVDGDESVLAIARTKAAAAGVPAQFVQGLAFALPYPDQTFTGVVSSLVFHHLTRANKQRTVAEVLRVLCPGGEFHLLDFGPPQTGFAKAMSLVLRQFEQVADNLDGVVPIMLRTAGFHQVEERSHYATVFGTLTLLAARKPAAQDEP